MHGICLLLSINICYLIQVADITLTSYSLVMSSTTCRPAPASTPPHPQQRRPFKTISGKSISCRAQLIWRICWRTTKKTTFQCRLTIAAQETEFTRERDEFKSKFAVQALSYATCPSNNTYFKVIQNFSKYFGAFRSNSKQFWNQTAARAAGKCLVSSAFLFLLETWLLGSFLFALFHSLKLLSCSSCAAPPFELCSGGVDEVTVASNSLIIGPESDHWLCLSVTP